MCLRGSEWTLGSEWMKKKKMRKLKANCPFSEKMDEKRKILQQKIGKTFWVYRKKIEKLDFYDHLKNIET